MTMNMRGLLVNGARETGRRGFTLIELLVVILIILMVSAVTLPSVISAFNHRQVSEAARILQAGLVGARDTAINNNAPAGIRLLPDPMFSGQSLNAPGVQAGVTALDPRVALASNRFVPIQLAPDYSEGLVNLVDTAVPGSISAPASLLAAYALYGTNPTTAFPYPALKGGGYYLAATSRMLYIEQSVYNFTTGFLNPPTSWYWNIRIGDRLQIANTGIYYTVVGPMNVPNPELFVNVGPPGTIPPLTYIAVINGTTYNWNPEILFLVNGQDDDHDGYVDNGFDGIDNDGDGIVDQVIDALPTPLSEWTEIETWQSSILNRGAHTILPTASPAARWSRRAPAKRRFLRTW